MVETPASTLYGDLKSRAPLAKCRRIRPFWQRWRFGVASTVCAAIAAAAAAAAAATTWWRLPLPPPLGPELRPVAHVAPFSSFADISFSAAGITSGSGHNDHARRPSCEPSDDPEYTCLLSRPPGAFDKELMVYLSAGHGQLSVKVVVVAGLLRDDGGDGGGGGGRQRGEAAWVSVGVSPDGRMAGPSEAVVGFISEEADGTQGPEVLRYRMDGYSPSSVVELPEEWGQVLSDKAVETDADGSLILRFKRSFSLPANGRDGQFTSKEPDGRPLLSSPGSVTLDASGKSVVPGERHLQISCQQQPSLREESNDRVRSEACGDGDEEFPWLDPRDDGVVLLWAYASSGSLWPSYHDRTGAFPLPRGLSGGGFGFA